MDVLPWRDLSISAPFVIYCTRNTSSAELSKIKKYQYRQKIVPELSDNLGAFALAPIYLHFQRFLLPSFNLLQIFTN